MKSIASTNSAITVTTFTHSFNQPSIIAKIPGTSSNLGTAPTFSHYHPLHLPSNSTTEPLSNTTNSHRGRSLRLHRRLLHRPRPRRRRQRLRRRHHPRSAARHRRSGFQAQEHHRVSFLRWRGRRAFRLAGCVCELCECWEDGFGCCLSR